MNRAEFTELCDSAKIRVVLADLRIIPRIMVILYGWVIYDSYLWFKALEAPTTQQTSFITLLWGAAAAWFGLYVNSGNGKK
jgi:hypothetical protein